MTQTPPPRPAPSQSGAGRLRAIVLRSGALGDFILTLPVLERLRGLAAEVEVTYGGRSSFGTLARTCGLADAVISDDAPEFVSLFARSDGAATKVRRAFGGFDVAVSFLASPDVTASLIGAGVGEVWAADPLPRSGGSAHAADHLIAALGPRARGAGEARPRVHVPDDVAGKARELLAARGVEGGFLLVHPGSGSARKNWNVEGFVRTAALARERSGLPTVVVLGPAEKEEPGSFGELESVGAASFDSPRLPLLAGIASLATCFLGNDSGCSHLAAACGTPTVSVFGPTDPAVWAPRGDRVTVLGGSGGGLDEVTPQVAHDAIVGLLGTG